MLKNDYYSQTAQKLKVGQKRPKLLKVSFSRSKKGNIVMKVTIVMTKQRKKSVQHQKLFLTKLVQNLLQNDRNGQNAQKLKIDQKR